jgi:hypothetical protein
MVREVEMEVESIPIDGCFHTRHSGAMSEARGNGTRNLLCCRDPKKQIPGSIADEPAMAPE